MSPILGLSGFGGGVSRFGGAIEPSDEYFEYVSMLLHGDGTNGAQNTSIVDSSSNNLTIGNNSNTVYQGSYTPYWDQWSNYFDGSGDYLTVSSNSAFAAPSDFTFECWVYPTSSAASQCIYLVNATNGLIIYTVSNKVVVRSFGVADLLTSSINLPLNQWVHIAAVRSGTTLSLFINGSRSNGGTVTNSTSFAQGSLIIGNNENNTLLFYGYISNLRFVKGTAVYDPTQTTLTVPTAPLTAITNTSLLTCQSNRFKDNSTNNFALTRSGDVKPEPFSPFPPAKSYSTTIHGGSGYFPSTSTGALEQLVSIPSSGGSSVINIATGDFTVECWFRYTSQQNYSRVLNFNDTYTTGSAGITLDNGAFGGSGKITFFVANMANPILSSNDAFTNYLNQWTHLAITRVGNTFYMYVNGVQQTSTYTSSSAMWATSTPTLYVGNGPDSVGGYSPMTGWISDVRVIKGTAIYTGNFTPPTQRLSAVSGTEALVSLSNAGIYDNSTKTTLNTVGNAQVSTSIKKYGSGSMYFDGTGDYLTAGNPLFLDLRSGDFTMEGWIYPTVVTGAQGICGLWSNQQGILYLIDSTLSFAWAPYSIFAPLLSSGTVSATTWAHVAVTRSGNTFRLFLNGTKTAEATSATNASSYSVPFGVGYYIVDGSPTAYFNGYIDDLRITKGIARYTANFTAPTKAFPNK